MGGMFWAENQLHYKGGPEKCKCEVRIPLDPLSGSKDGKFCLPPLMFWACPVEATARGSKEEGKLAASQVKLTEGAKSPPPIISEVG